MSTGAEPIIIDALRPRQWHQLTRAAVLLDLSAGDSFDVRAGGTINLWAGPENKPAGWPPELPITASALPYPHTYIGTLLSFWAVSASLPGRPVLV